jgi:hypothetical protein
MPPQNRSPTRALLLITILVLTLSPLLSVQALQLTATTEYTQYVHTYLNSPSGNYTVIDKPIFPITINNSQIQIGANWTIICPLQAGHSYHVYCYGAWVNISSTAKTDYDIYVYDPQGALESSHTEAAGLPEHLGTTTNDAFFIPRQSGNYSFVIKNDDRESQGAQAATFMIIENLQCNQWYTSSVEGKGAGNQSGFHTSWAYEFVTNASKVELYIKVPPTLDMYEARLYLMNNAQSLSINSIPLPLETGLYGNVSGVTGGYNFESQGYRGVAYASCEYMGESMFLNYTTNNPVTKLYQLVLIGEEGAGDIQFLLKTQFGNTSMTQVAAPTRVCPDVPAKIAYASNNASLESAQLSYTINNWNSTSTVDMAISNQTCNGTIPGQTAGSIVKYRINAMDILNNNLTATGNYTVKAQPTLNITAVKDPIRQGETLTITGYMTPNDNNSKVKVQFFTSNTTQTVNCTVTQEGNFTASFKPSSAGAWSVSAFAPETPTSWRGDSEPLTVTVNEPPLYVKYSLYIIICLAAVSAVGGAVWFLKFRGR